MTTYTPPGRRRPDRRASAGPRSAPRALTRRYRDDLRSLLTRTCVSLPAPPSGRGLRQCLALVLEASCRPLLGRERAAEPHPVAIRIDDDELAQPVVPLLNRAQTGDVGRAQALPQRQRILD